MYLEMENHATKHINAICKDRTIEGFDDYFPCKKNECKLKHIRQWFYLFINNTIEKYHLKLTEPVQHIPN